MKKKKVFQNPLTVRPCLAIIMTVASAGVVQWLESQPSKLVVWVRFPSPAPARDAQFALVAQVDRATAF